MQIVIEISNTLKQIADEDDFKSFTNPIWQQLLIEAVRNGTPLPKGHGRLIDADEFIRKVQADRKHACYITSWTADDVLNHLSMSYTPTIIEADKEE